jgi:hypothetical protein
LNTDEFDVISLHDSALRSLDPSVVLRYELTRDVADLPMERLASEPSPPVVFRARPLSVDYEGVTASGVSPMVARAIFREHVTRISGVPREMAKTGDDGKLTIETVNRYPMSLISEVVQVIVEAQDRVPGGDVPFSPSSSDTYSTRRDLSRRRTRLAQMVTALESVESEDAQHSEQG